ncbi:MAG: ADP-ribosylation protein [Gammaproteobacteria bacterium]|nr:ADP-ribosylation protein [Gammaproteobacteria bacterium]MBJ54903.1 ADP-ribosylation protein [Gammaproteobacteria bacterium]|tara:strand:+ start:841 stop:2073 length:1233 start_codon:yes stop_codon:yes gene_type:complete
MSDSIASRIENALWGAFIGDALAMPVHWFYSTDHIREQFPSGIDQYYPAPHPHPDSFMVGSSYQPDVKKAKACDRDFDILHEHTRFYRTSYSDFKFKLDAREGEHGNETTSLEERIHYHHGSQAGESTLGAGLLRLLMRSVISRGGYSQDGFMQDFIGYMTTPRDNSDPYTEIYLRRWFENYSLGIAPENCAEQQRQVWSIDSVGGLIRPLVLSLLNSDNQFIAMGMAITHQQLTHRSEVVSSGLGVLVPALLRLVNGSDPQKVFKDLLAQVPSPAISGDELFKAYREHDGPGNIPADEAWRLHMSFLKEGAETRSTDYFATACYVEQALPLMAKLGKEHDCGLISTLRANAEIGGDSVHRGLVLGLLLAAGSSEVPEEWITGLKDHEALREEIRQFAALAASGTGHLTK